MTTVPAVPGTLPPLPVALPRPCIDNHTHIQATHEFSGLSVDDNLALAQAVGVTRLVEVGCDVESSRFAVGLAELRPQVVAAVAMHPNDAARAGAGLPQMIEQIDELAGHTGVRAVGETGLDHYRTRDDHGRRKQVESFIAHIEIATRRELTLVIHDRDAHRQILEVLDGEGVPKRVVMHCFSGDARFAEQCLERGFWLSFPGVVTYKNAPDLRAALAVTPADKVLVETDAPYLTPAPERGRANAPYLLPHTLRFIAQQRGVDLETLCDQVTANTFEAFGGAWGSDG